MYESVKELMLSKCGAGEDFFFNFNFYFILLYNTVLVLPYIDMNPPRVYMWSKLFLFHKMNKSSCS